MDPEGLQFDSITSHNASFFYFTVFFVFFFCFFFEQPVPHGLNCNSSSSSLGAIPKELGLH